MYHCKWNTILNPTSGYYHRYKELLRAMPVAM